MSARRLKHGAWTWVKQPDTESGCEVWLLSDECRAALGSRWVLKNYGGAEQYVERERPAFTGWRLVSGGPCGPMHANVEDAAEYARVYLNERVLDRKRALQAQIDAIEALLCS